MSPGAVYPSDSDIIFLTRILLKGGLLPPLLFIAYLIDF
jgi:hypothetical protein